MGLVMSHSGIISRNKATRDLPMSFRAGSQLIDLQ
jgi:hypothetical protein